MGRLYQLSNLLKEAQIDLPDFFDSSIGATICREPDTEKLAWRLAREIHRRNNGRIPSSLQPYLDRPDFEQEERARESESFRKELLGWLAEGKEEGAATPRRELRVIWKIEGGYDPLEARIQIDLRVNSPKLKEGSRNFFQVRGLCNEAANRPELFTAEDQVLLRWLSDFLPLLLTDKKPDGQPLPARQPEPAHLAHPMGPERPLPLGGGGAGRVQPAQRPHRPADPGRGGIGRPLQRLAARLRL